MPSFELQFERTPEGRIVFIDELFDYQNNGTEGFVEFDGYFYADIGDESEYGVQCNDHTFVAWMRGDGYQKEGDPYTTYYDSLGQEIYEVTFTKREVVKDTSSYGPLEDSDGEEMNVCFFPTKRQRIFFTVQKVVEKVGVPVVFG